MINYFRVGNRTYDVLVTAIEESWTILYSENTGRTLAAGARMTLDPLGTFFSHKVTVRRKQGYEQEFDDLVDYVSTPRYDGIPVEIVHNQTSIAYEAYISSGSRALNKIDLKNNKVYWGELTLNIVPIEAQVKP